MEQNFIHLPGLASYATGLWTRKFWFLLSSKHIYNIRPRISMINHKRSINNEFKLVLCFQSHRKLPLLISWPSLCTLQSNRVIRFESIVNAEAENTLQSWSPFESCSKGWRLLQLVHAKRDIMQNRDQNTTDRCLQPSWKRLLTSLLFRSTFRSFLLFGQWSLPCNKAAVSP